MSVETSSKGFIVAAPYSRPPITEAVLEFRLKSAVSQAIVEKARKAIGKSYVRVEDLKEVKVQVAPEAETVQVESAFGGKRLYSEDGADIVWLRPLGVSVSRLTPYHGWDSFRERTHKVWTKWRDVLGPRELASVGLRYINRIDIPVSENDQIRIENFLRLTPNFPDQVFYHFALQTQTPLGEFQLIVNTGSAPPALIGHVSYLLDLDLVKETDIPLREDDLWSMIAKMRDHKNQAFESYITDNTRNLFK